MNITGDKYSKVAIHQKLYTMMNIIDTSFRANNLDYIATGGTLLGCIREGKIINHDDDIDLIVFEDQKNILIKVLDELSKSGEYKYIDAGFGYKFVDTHTYIDGKDNGAQIDLFIYSKQSNSIKGLDDTCTIWPKECKFNNNIIFPIKRKKFNTININVPNNPEKFLTQAYGDWRIPVIYNHNRTY